MASLTCRTFAASGVSFNKGATLFDPVMRGLQEKYADQLLNHVNPYTGFAYKNDPVIFTTEITNEDSFFLSWNPDQPQPHAWRRRQLPGLLTAGSWTAGRSLPARGPTLNRLRNPGFEAGLAGWFSWTDGSAQAAFTADSAAYEGSQALKVAVTQADGVSWHVQFGQGNLALQAGRTYRLRFAARPAQPQPCQAR